MPDGHPLYYRFVALDRMMPHSRRSLSDAPDALRQLLRGGADGPCRLFTLLRVDLRQVDRSKTNQWMEKFKKAGFTPNECIQMVEKVLREREVRRILEQGIETLKNLGEVRCMETSGMVVTPIRGYADPVWVDSVRSAIPC